LALISARMSDASFRTWRSAPQAAKAILNAFDLVLPRDEAASARLSALGARVSGLADMKFGAEQLPDDLARRETLRSSIGDRCVILAASTHSGEESLILEAFSALGDVRECALLVIAPRRPDRGSVVTSAARGFGFATSRQGAGESPKGVAVYVADGLGELGLWYRLADLAVIGGSLVSGVGGHNPLEPARLGCAFIAGPFVENWPVYTSLRSCGATETAATAKALQTWFQGVIEASDRLNAMAARAGAWVADRDLEGEAALARVTALLPG
jgi:3-deoxy-D-manno-octulosonic-acid transferase